MSFTIKNLEYALLIFIRVTAIVSVTPLFGNNAVPVRVKAAISFFLSIIMINTVDYTAVSYVGTIGYSVLVMKEAITGLVIGIGSGFCLYILNYSGHFIDMELGLSMAMEFDPTSNLQSTITANFLSHLFIIMFLMSDMHYFIIDALNESYKAIPIGGANIDAGLYHIIVKYIVDYFVIALRIALPIFACVFVINIILGILAKVAPQMNMFVIGMQLKIFVGLFILYMIMGMLPGIVDFIFEEMRELTGMFMDMLSP
ncbi:MAG: flagellar biosynthetic protein FliR [Lachnospiraceae bacterium]|nr:flagellar biosynthetic protein FliR [Lachnospiraceae bacterium]